MTADNPLSPGETPNPVPHVHHHYALIGGPTYWAQCECGEKLAGDNGPIVGSRAKVEKAMP